MFASLILIFLLIALGQTLLKDSADILADLEDASPQKILIQSALLVGLLLYIQSNSYGSFGTAPFKGTSLLLYLIIIYETAAAVVLNVARDRYVQAGRQAIDLFPLAYKIIPAGELLVLAYILATDSLLI